MIRKFMNVMFPTILDILFILSIIGVLIMAISVASMDYYHSVRTFFISFFPGLIGVIGGFGIIYVLLDIRDALQSKK